MFQRFVTGKLLDVLSYSPVVYVHGPYRCGRSTLLQALSGMDLNEVHGSPSRYEYISLEDSSLEEFATRDPMGFVDQLPEYVILDDAWPSREMVDSIKTRIERDRDAGTIILTGSAAPLVRENLQVLGDKISWIPMHSLAQCEVNHQIPVISFQHHENRLLSCLLEGRVPNSAQSLKPLERNLAEIVASGGYPEPLQLPVDIRRQWYEEYVNALERFFLYAILRGIHAIPRFMSRIAAQTTTFFSLSRLANSVKLPRSMLHSLISMLQESYLIDSLPVWPTNKVSRVKSRKLYMADTGLACLMLNQDSEKLWQNRPLFERLVENLIYLELRRQLSWMKDSVGLYHCQDKDHAKVDFIIERSDQIITGINVTTNGSVSDADFNGLRHVASRIQGFKFGVVLYDGESVIPFDQRMLAVPIRMLFEDSSVE